MTHNFKNSTLSNSLNNFISKLGKRLEGSHSSARRKSTRRSPKLFSYGNLEDRKMLAAAAVIDGTLEVRGDNTSEVLSVRQVESDLIVYARSGSGNGENIFRTSAENVEAIAIRGFGGNDQIINRTEIPSLLMGGDGNDLVVGGTGDDVIQGGTGNDRIIGDFGSNPLNISTLTLGGDDMLAGGDGNDIIMGVGGDDTINGQDGNDFLNGGAGNDHIAGNAGDDKVIGNDGNDLLSGNDGDDLLSGENGNDVLLGGSGDDLMYGGEGNDRLRGNLGIDIVNAGAGDDVLFSSGYAQSSDRLIGGHGDDTYSFEGPGEAGLLEVVHGGTLAHGTIVETAFSGNDTIEYVGPGFRNDPRAIFDNNTNLVFRYDLRLVASETASTIENYSDLREELLDGIGDGAGDGIPLVDDVTMGDDDTDDNTNGLLDGVVDIVDNDVTNLKGDGLLDDVVDALDDDDANNDGDDLLDIVFEGDFSLEIVVA